MRKSILAYDLVAQTCKSLSSSEAPHATVVRGTWSKHKLTSMMDGSIDFSFSAKLAIKTDSWEGKLLVEIVLILIGSFMVWKL